MKRRGPDGTRSLAPIAVTAWLTSIVACGGGSFSAATVDGGPTEGGRADANADAVATDVVYGQSTADGPASGCNCHPAPPAGWNGPGERYEGAPGQPVPACGSAFDPAYRGHVGLVMPSDDCTCTCAPPTGGSCSAAVVAHYFELDGCSTDLGMTQTLPSTCSAIAALGSSMTLSNPPPSPPGSCTATSSGMAPPTWAGVDSACQIAAPAEASCGAGNLCVPDQDEGFAFLCIWRSGLAMCPDAYPKVRVSYTAFLDTRTCGACGCMAATSACTLSVGLGSSASTCTPAVASAAGCIDLGGSTDVFADQNLVAGTCAPTGGGVTGSLGPTMPTTFCCTQ